MIRRSFANAQDDSALWSIWGAGRRERAMPALSYQLPLKKRKLSFRIPPTRDEESPKFTRNLNSKPHF